MLTHYIEINSGDEYRAKVENYKEKTEKEKTFFQDIYDKAKDVTNEIIQGMQEYSQNASKSGKYKAKYQGMGNNVIAFCAERGQGKTSAMQSFSNILKKGIKEVNDVYFEVLDSIDPSSLDKGESIVRVLISRIFDNFTGILGSMEKYDYNEYNFQKKKRDIFTLFQECYENIDYLRKEKRVEQSSLEKLAQLGSSARLKSNLHDLIEKYLEILNICDEVSNSKKYKCLVVQIDDADLAVDNVFQIFEDIRNYFSIPNVLVLMAANFTQLRNAIHQCYLKQYKYMIKLQSKDFADECSLMAARYMEKTVPVGHRIVLPDIDTIIKEEFQSIKVRYDCKPALFDNNDESCKDIQEQLLKALYQKTGIILLKEKGKLHPFLPHTLRELTHFVKMLSEMTTINHKIVFQVNPDYDNTDEIENLQANLSVIKVYFLEYWCHSHMKKYHYQRLMEKIGLANQQLPLVYKSIMDYLQINIHIQPEKITCYNIFNDLAKEKLEYQPELQEALYLYGTIILNEWFVKVARNRDEINNLIKIVGQILDASQLNNSGEIKGYNFLKFDFNYDVITQYLGKEKESDETKIWFKDYCNIPISSKEEIESLVILENGKPIWNKNCQKAHFNFFQVLMVAIIQYWQSADRESKLQNEQDSSEDNNQNETRNDEIISSRLVMAKNIIANYDIQRRIQEKINDICKSLEHGQDLKVFSDIYLDFYRAIDLVISEDAEYLQEQGNLKDIFTEHMGTNIRLQMLMLSNKKNYKQYLIDYGEYLEKTIQDKIELLKNYNPDLNNDEYLLESKVPMFPGIIDFDVSNSYLKELKELNNQLSNENEELFTQIKKLLIKENNQKFYGSITKNEDINNIINEYIQKSMAHLKNIKQKLESIV